MYKRILSLVVIIAVAIFFTDYGKHYTYSLITNVVTNQAVPTIEPKELNRLEEPYILLDTRTPTEYKVSHLENARLVNSDAFKVSEVADIPKNTKIIVYCAVGTRSSKIGIELLDAGYTDVHNLRGGIINWMNEEYPVYDANGQTNRIHGYSKFWGFWLTNGEEVYGP